MRLGTKILMIGLLVGSFGAGQLYERHVLHDEDERLHWRLRVLELEVELLDSRAAALREDAARLSRSCNAFQLREKM